MKAINARLSSHRTLGFADQRTRVSSTVIAEDVGLDEIAQFFGLEIEGFKHRY